MRRAQPGGRGRRSLPLGRPAPLVAALTAGGVLGLAGAAAAAAVISVRVRSYHSDTVRVAAGHPVSRTLAPGRYGAFGGCADQWGCAQLAPRDLSVRGARSGGIGAVPYTRLEQRADAGQPFNLDLTFTVPVREAVRIALNRNPGQPVLIAPTAEESGLIHGELVAATGCAVLLLGSLAALGWPLAPRGGRRGIARSPLETADRGYLELATGQPGARRAGRTAAGWTAWPGASRCSRPAPLP